MFGLGDKRTKEQLKAAQNTIIALKAENRRLNEELTEVTEALTEIKIIIDGQFDPPNEVLDKES